MIKSKMALIVILIAVIIVSPAFAAKAYGEPNTTIVGLTNAGKQVDGQNVCIQGEVVGDIVNDENGYKWITLSDGGASISVLIPERDVSKIKHLGRYNAKGTRIEVAGLFQIDCEEHDGLTDVHANTVTVVQDGYEVASVLDMREIQIGALLIIVGGCLIFIHWRLKERTR